jgi:hypothetical protein
MFQVLGPLAIRWRMYEPSPHPAHWSEMVRTKFHKPDAALEMLETCLDIDMFCGTVFDLQQMTAFHDSMTPSKLFLSEPLELPHCPPSPPLHNSTVLHCGQYVILLVSRRRQSNDAKTLLTVCQTLTRWPDQSTPEDSHSPFLEAGRPLAH